MAKAVNASSAARQEMAAERARIYGKKSQPISPVEQAAERWRREREEAERIEAERKSLEEEEMIATQRVSASFIPQRERALDAVGWAQYSPCRKEAEEKKTRRVNTATIWCHAKKLMAREWARAKGIKRRDPRLVVLEREATRYQVQREEEKKRTEERNRSIHRQREMIERQREMVERSLQISRKKLLEMQENGAPPMAKLLEDTLTSVGEVIEVSWTDDGCEVWIEPWEERRLRRRRGDGLPVIYQLWIDNQLHIASYGKVNERQPESLSSSVGH